MTPEQETKMKEALGDGSDWPKFTDDAEVNYEPPWNEAGLAGQALYLEEISLADEEGMFLDD